MLQNPLTPPQDDGIEYRDHLESPGLISPQNPTLASPVSYADAEAHGSSSRSASPGEELVVDTAEQDVSDEDMTDGGAALHAGPGVSEDELNDDIPLPDSEIDPETLLGLLNPAYFPSSLFEDIEVLATMSQPTLEFGSPPNPADEIPQTSVLPTIDGATQQLQHLQEAPGYLNLIPLPLEANFLPNYSNSPISYSTLEFSLAYNSIHNLPFDVSSLNEEIHVMMSQIPPPTTANQAVFTAPFLDESIPITDDMMLFDTIANILEVDDRANLGLGGFLYSWAAPQPSYVRDVWERQRLSHGRTSSRAYRVPSLMELDAQRDPYKLPPVKRTDLQGDRCDFQRLDWEKLGVSRADARELRQNTYKNYTNLRTHPALESEGVQLRDNQNYFKFRQMNFDNRAFLSHFQLRNMISCASRNHVFYAGKTKVYQWDPTCATPAPRRVAMNLTSSDTFFDAVQISTIAINHNILFVGGFCGEYAMINLRAHKSTKHTEGIATYHDNAITNHVQIHLSRGSYTPQAAIASNDSHLRVLDVATNRIVATHGYDHAINCSALSPDQRLRVLVGDTREVMICNAETGEILQNLQGHADYGFACDWADDGWTVATGNQDGLVKIWDARKWTNSQGVSSPVTTIAVEMAGVRKLKFSPLGSGKRVLVAAEAADIVNVIDAETFKRKQALNFFGEVGGFDFANGGRDLFVAVCDEMRGGIMEFERADLASTSTYEIEDLLDGQPFTRRRIKTGYDWRRTDEDVTFANGNWGTLEKRRTVASSVMDDHMGYF